MLKGAEMHFRGQLDMAVLTISEVGLGEAKSLVDEVAVRIKSFQSLM